MNDNCWPYNYLGWVPYMAGPQEREEPLQAALYAATGNTKETAGARNIKAYIDQED